jgi:hypothetical protein
VTPALIWSGPLARSVNGRPPGLDWLPGGGVHIAIVPTLLS